MLSPQIFILVHTTGTETAKIKQKCPPQNGHFSARNARKQSEKKILCQVISQVQHISPSYKNIKNSLL